jgi:hypothetical protein
MPAKAANEETNGRIRRLRLLSMAIFFGKQQIAAKIFGKYPKNAHIPLRWVQYVCRNRTTVVLPWVPEMAIPTFFIANHPEDFCPFHKPIGFSRNQKFGVVVGQCRSKNGQCFAGFQLLGFSGCRLQNGHRILPATAYRKRGLGCGRNRPHFAL